MLSVNAYESLTSNIGSPRNPALKSVKKDEPDAEESEVQSDDDENVDPADFGIDSADGESEIRECCIYRRSRIRS